MRREVQGRGFATHSQFSLAGNYYGEDAEAYYEEVGFRLIKRRARQ